VTTTPTTVDSTVFSLAGFDDSTYGAVPAGFYDPVPLGVRFFNYHNGVERWITEWIGDITYRSVVPGGYASATIPLHIPHAAGADQLGFSRIAEMFNRIQIIDLGSCEVVWEGRIEDPARQVDPDTWQIGALGSMIAASDVNRPVMYADSLLDRWTPGETITSDGSFGDVVPSNTENSKDDDGRTLITVLQHKSWFTDYEDEYSWRYDLYGFPQAVARIKTTLEGGTTVTLPSPMTPSDLRMLLGTSGVPHLDNTAFGATSGNTKTNVVGTDWTDIDSQFFVFGRCLSTGGGPTGDTTQWEVPSSGRTEMKLRNPIVIGMRRDRTGAKLTTAASYPHDYVTVSEVVEDVVGRFLNGGWYEGGINTPWPGSVRDEDIYIDTSDTTQILNLVYADGATAADILNDLCEQVQTDAYWAIWESTTGIQTTGQYLGYRFEWVTWPDNWGYSATSEDGLESQPNGDSVFNYLTYRYQDQNDNNTWHVQNWWLGNEMAPELLTGGFTRAVTVNKEDPTDSTTATTNTLAALQNARKVLNAGTLTVRRPVAMFDSGVSGNGGACRMVPPYAIKPGKLVMISDLLPRTGLQDMSHGDTAPTRDLDGTIFRVISTEYNSADGSCTLELDELKTWHVPNQITKGGTGKSKTIRIQ
jgi:hypothetical protein